VNNILNKIDLVIDEGIFRSLGYIVGMVASCVIGFCLFALFRRDR
jgi:hypothetical protein